MTPVNNWNLPACSGQGCFKFIKTGFKKKKSNQERKHLTLVVFFCFFLFFLFKRSLLYVCISRRKQARGPTRAMKKSDLSATIRVSAPFASFCLAGSFVCLLFVRIGDSTLGVKQLYRCDDGIGQMTELRERAIVSLWR